VGERDKVRLTASGQLAAVLPALRAIPGVEEATAGEEGIDLLVAGADRALAPILAAVAEGGVSVSSVDIDEPNLEAVFLHLTGKALRE
jgi:ABC-2 type transport system ATP-binding protein